MKVLIMMHAVTLFIGGIVTLRLQDRVHALEAASARRGVALRTIRAEASCTLVTKRLLSVEALLKDLLGSKSTYERMLHE